MKQIFAIFLFCSITVNVTCQSLKRSAQNNEYVNDYEVVKGHNSGIVSGDNKNLPLLVKKDGNKTLLDSINRNIMYMNGSNKVKDSLNVLANEKFAYLDKEQNIIVPFGEYDIAKPFGLGRKAIVANKNKYGIIDEFGKQVLPLEYDFIEQPSQYATSFARFFVATIKNNVTFFNEKLEKMPVGNIVSYFNNYNQELIITNNDGKIGRISYEGKLTIPVVYDTLSRWRISGYIAKKENRFGYITKNNKIIKPFEYKSIKESKDGIVFINQNNKAGLCDEAGKLVIPFEYEAIYETWYNNKYPKIHYIVQKNEKIGTIDEDNNVVIPIIYDGLSGWVEYGPAAHFVKKDGKYGLISHQGKIMIPIEYDYVAIPNEGLTKVLKNGMFGVANMKGELIIPCEYEAIDIDIPFFRFGDEKHNDKIVTYKNNTYQYFDLKGKLTSKNVSPHIIEKENEWMSKRCNTPIEERGMPSNEHWDFHMILVK